MSFNDISLVYETESGMRVGISSANASDNWTNVKLDSGVTINMAINLPLISQYPPVSAKCHIIPDEVKIVLQTRHTMYANRTVTETVEFTRDNIDQFVLQIDDNCDVFRMLKYALIFVGIVKWHKDHACRSNDILGDIGSFTGGHGLYLSVSNLGPSRSGFASSSAVASNLLKVLYSCCSSTQYIANDDALLGSMVLLFENSLGLKSGRQDVDGLLPSGQGLKLLNYHQTTDFVVPQIDEHLLRNSLFDLNYFCDHFLLVNSGIARAPTLGLHRGLNMRFWAYLSKEPTRYKAIQQSYLIHDCIIRALQRNNMTYLGKLFLDYMACRERIDPGATRSVYDQHYDGKVLRLLFDPLVERGLISGGMFTGAMGGGCAMLCLTEHGKTHTAQYLQQLKQMRLENKQMPFQYLKVIPYVINKTGIKLHIHK